MMPLIKTIFSDPLREVVLQQIQFEALVGALSDYQLHTIIAPHLINAGADNTGWYGNFKGQEMLFAQGRRGLSLAVACSVPWLARSAGYVGTSDGWQTLARGEGFRPPYPYKLDDAAAVPAQLKAEVGPRPRPSAATATATATAPIAVPAPAPTPVPAPPKKK